MTYTFNQPQGGSGYFKPAEANGHLILITNVHAIETRWDQMKGADAPIATVDLVDLDSEDRELRQRCFVTHAGIINKFNVGDHMVLGRIGQVPTKSGMQAWVLLPYDENSQDGQIAGAWLDSQARPQLNQPAAPAAPAQQAPQAQAAPAPAPVQQSQPGMADPNDPAVQNLLRTLQQ